MSRNVICNFDTHKDLSDWAFCIAKKVSIAKVTSLQLCPILDRNMEAARNFQITALRNPSWYLKIIICFYWISHIGVSHEIVPIH